MASDLAAADAITKIGYGDIHDQLDGFVVALDLVKKGSKYLTNGNTEVQFATRMGRSRGIGARGEDEDLPTAGQGKDARASIFLKYQYGAIQGNGQVFKQVTTNAQGFVDWMQREMSDIKESLARDLSRQVYGDGTGTLALLTANESSATVLDVDDTHFLEEDMTIDVLTVGTLGNAVPTKGNTAELTIVSVNHTASTITVSGGTVTANTGSALVLTSGGTNNWKKEWEGLGLIISSSTLHAINPATYPKWTPGYTEGSVGSLTELDLMHMTQGIHSKGGKVTDILTSYGVANAYWDLLEGNRRYKGDERLSGGYGDVPVLDSVFGKLPITLDHSCPEGTMYAINKEELYLHQLGDWAWMDKDGSMWKQVPNKDAYRAYIFQYSNIGTFRRNTHGKLTGITEA